MRIARLVVDNWLCFSHADLALDAKVYAVVARHKEDGDRSNWLGKSSLFRAVRMALYGDHGARTEDGWIRRGQELGRVRVEFEDGSWAERTRKRGKSTVLTYEASDGAFAKGPAAQELLTKRVGLTLPDFEATCYVEQGMMARLMRMLPSERLRVVSEWFRLQPIRECREDVANATADLSWRVEVESRNLASRRDIAREELGGREVTALRADIVVARARVEEAEGRLAAEQDALEKNARRIAAKDAVAEYEAVERDGKALRREADALGKLEDLAKAHQEASHALVSARAESRRLAADADAKSEVAAGKFDGACPVARIECPAKDVINRSRLLTGKARAEALRSLEEAVAAEKRAEKREAGALARLQEAERKHDRLARMREDLKRLYPRYVEGQKVDAEDPQKVRDRVAKAQAELVNRKAALASLERSLGLVERCEAEAKTIAASVAKLEGELATHREGVAVFTALTRRVAEVSLAEVEDGANAALRDSGIDLSLELRWQREGGDPAKSCDKCGHPFPPSRKVRECERCGAPRGHNVIDKLEPVVSNESGGALDLAGFAMQLAASRWLRGDRLAQWSVALVDEPYGALDAANRRALSAHVAGMLRGRYGFEQAFVIAHHSSVLDALPGRIVIEAEGERGAIVSTARVVA